MAFTSKGHRFLHYNLPDDHEHLMKSHIRMRKFEGVVDTRSWSVDPFHRHQHLLELMTERVGKRNIYYQGWVVIYQRVSSTRYHLPTLCFSFQEQLKKSDEGEGEPKKDAEVKSSNSDVST